MLLSAVSVLVVAQSSSEVPEGLMNNPVLINSYKEKEEGREEKSHDGQSEGIDFRNEVIAFPYTKISRLENPFPDLWEGFCGQ